MSEMDVASFMEKNGREFFVSDSDSHQRLSEMLEISLELPVRKVKLLQIADAILKHGRPI